MGGPNHLMSSIEQMQVILARLSHLRERNILRNLHHTIATRSCWTSQSRRLVTIHIRILRNAKYEKKKLQVLIIVQFWVICRLLTYSRRTSWNMTILQSRKLIGNGSYISKGALPCANKVDKNHQMTKKWDPLRHGTFFCTFPIIRNSMADTIVGDSWSLILRDARLPLYNYETQNLTFIWAIVFNSVDIMLV